MYMGMCTIKFQRPTAIKTNAIKTIFPNVWNFYSNLIFVVLRVSKLPRRNASRNQFLTCSSCAVRHQIRKRCFQNFCSFFTSLHRLYIYIYIICIYEFQKNHCLLPTIKNIVNDFLCKHRRNVVRVSHTHTQNISWRRRRRRRRLRQWRAK